MGSPPGFGLFDLTGANWLADRSLGWFYPVYLHRKLDRPRPVHFGTRRKIQRLLIFRRIAANAFFSSLPRFSRNCARRKQGAEASGEERHRGRRFVR
jgi:hypothetical protein